MAYWRQRERVRSSICPPISTGIVSEETFLLQAGTSKSRWKGKAFFKPVNFKRVLAQQPDFLRQLRLPRIRTAIQFTAAKISDCKTLRKIVPIEKCGIDRLYQRSLFNAVTIITFSSLELIVPIQFWLPGSG